jgi:hypothetical protein
MPLTHVCLALPGVIVLAHNVCAHRFVNLVQLLLGKLLARRRLARLASEGSRALRRSVCGAVGSSVHRTDISLPLRLQSVCCALGRDRGGEFLHVGVRHRDGPSSTV